MAEGKDKKVNPVWITDGSDVEDIEVKMLYERHGQSFELVHLFREPTAADKRKYNQHLGRTKIQRGSRNYVETDWVGANELLYDRCIKEVNGYDVDSTKNGWKERIPPDHKSAAVQELLRQSGAEVDGDEAKN